MKEELSVGQSLSCSHPPHPHVFEVICLIGADGGQLLWDALMRMRSSVGIVNCEVNLRKVSFDRAAGTEEAGAGKNTYEPNTGDMGE